MKARVKATGEIIDVEHTAYDVNGKVIWRYADIEDAYLYTDEQLDFNLEENHKGSQIVPLPYEPDYWEKLKHQYAGSFFKSFLDKFDNTTSIEKLMDNSIKLAKIFINKLKEESQCEK